MLAYVIKRLWQMVPTLFGVVLLVFVARSCKQQYNFYFFDSSLIVIMIIILNTKS